MPAQSETGGNYKVLLAALGALLFPALILLYAKGGEVFSSGPSAGDNLMRLVQVRDWMAGQGWFDLVQHRLNPPLGVDMHWSRLVDAPIAAIMSVAGGYTSTAGAEAWAVLIWPLLLLYFALAALGGAAWQLIGRGGMVVALAYGALAVSVVAYFAPGRIDHHNVQLALVAVLMRLAFGSGKSNLMACLTGIVCALMLTIGLETLPFVAVTGIWFVLRWAFSHATDADAAPLKLFGMGFALTAPLLYVATVSPDHYFDTACDAVSYTYIALAFCAGTGCVCLGVLSNHLHFRYSRLIAATLLGVAIIGLVGAINPACLAGPYTAVDAILHEIWLSRVEEAKSLFAVWQHAPGKAWGKAAVPILGLCAIAAILMSPASNLRAEWWLAGMLLATAFALMCVQVRAAPFANLLAILPCTWMALRLWQLMSGPQPAFISGALFILVWASATNFTQSLIGSTIVEPYFKSKTAELARPVGDCGNLADYHKLANLAPGLVLNEIDLGPSVLAYTHHSVFSAPYHRNVEGIKKAHETLFSPPYIARAAFTGRKISYVLFCSNGTTVSASADRPMSLIQKLARGSGPTWLEPIALTASSKLKAFRFVDVKDVSNQTQRQKTEFGVRTLLKALGKVEGYSTVAGMGQDTPVPPSPQ
ncbi:MAG: hypothetical protein ACR2OR_15805 [Hyphomicrobiales bacterium]